MYTDNAIELEALRPTSRFSSADDAIGEGGGETASAIDRFQRRAGRGRVQGRTKLHLPRAQNAALLEVDAADLANSDPK